jgi:hypothetical protein
MARAFFSIITSIVVFYAFFSLFMAEVGSYVEERIALFLSLAITLIYGVSVFFLFSP